MDEEEYRDFVSQVNSGVLLVGVDRAFARKFYTDIPLSKIIEETGEVPYFEKLVVWLAFLSAPITLLASCILSVLAFRWFAILVIPVSIIVYFFFSGQSSMPGRGMLGISILLALAVGTLFTNLFSSQFVPLYLIAAVFSLWASRLVYCAAKTFILNFVLRNQRALEFIRDHIQVRQAVN